MSNIVITGSSKGIGFGLAKEFASRGHQVMIAGSSQATVDDALARLESHAELIKGCPCDVRKAEQVQALWDRAITAFGSVDIWINNAGLARTVWPVIDIPDDQIEQMITSNLLGTTFGCKVAVKGMLKQGHGKLFNMLGGGSDGEFRPGMGVYGSTKHGMDYLTNALIKEHKDSNLVIAKIRPGMIITEGVIREIKADPANFEKSRSIMNVLCDTMETVAPFLVDEILNCEKSGSKIRWLSGGKIGLRMLMARLKKFPDKFEQYGV
jgi:NAD(P)-dependent dehydrogenase (short-subunit alcohol dehydrogenase family)